MIRSLTVFYLHKAGKLDSRHLPAMETGLNDAFREFCRETFDTNAPLDYPPLKLTVTNEVEAFAKALFTSRGPRGVLTDAGRACCLFVIDDDMMETSIKPSDASRRSSSSRIRRACRC